MAEEHGTVRGLVLAGGGAKGSYQVGVYQALLELGWLPDVITGASVGSLNAALFVMGKVNEAADLWRSLDNHGVLELPEGKTPEELRDFLLETLRGGGLNTEPLGQTIDQYMDEDAIRASHIKYGLVITEMNTLRSVQCTLDDIPKGKLKDYMLASSACFPALRPYEIDGVKYPAILCGVARFHGMPVTVLGHRKGATLEENLRCNFGMPGPEGYRKALRVMKQAEKFGRPIITFIDTPGAYPGKDAEERGQGEAIARNLMEMSGLAVPVLAVVTGEGSSGGALGLGVANHILMLENAVYSVLSPEGFASILWKDSSRSGEACTMMKLTAQDLYNDGIVEEIIPEPLGGAQRGRQVLFARMDTAIAQHLAKLCRMSSKALTDQRYKKYRRIGEMRGA